MSAERQLAQARAALRAGDRVRARQVLGSLLRQDPTMVEGWVLLSRAMHTRAAAQWCLQCAAKFIQVDDVDLSSTSAHPDSTVSDPASPAEDHPARPKRDDESALSGPRQPAAAERSRRTSHRLAEAWQALESHRFAEDSELTAVSQALESRRQGMRRHAGPGRSGPKERDCQHAGAAAHQASLSALERHERDSESGAGQDRTRSAADDVDPGAPVPPAARHDTEMDRRPADPAPVLQTSTTAWRAVYLEPARAFLEEEEKDSQGPPRADEESGGAPARLWRMAVRAIRTRLEAFRHAERPTRTVAQLLLFALGVLLLCNGASLLYPRVVPSLRRDAWMAEAAPALRAQGEPAPLTSAQTEESAPSRSATGLGRSRRHEAAPSTAEATSRPSAALGQSVDASPEPNEAGALHASLASSDLPETRAKPDLIIRKAVPTGLVIPALQLDAPVVPVTSTTSEIQGRQVRTWDVPDDGAAGWHAESAPLGVVGNTVLNGHNTTEGEVFRDLHRLQPGDEIMVYAGDEQHLYTVATTAVFREAGAPLERRLEHAQLLGATGDKRLTLVTCHPYGSTVNRLIVTCFPQGDGAERGNLRE